MPWPAPRTVVARNELPRLQKVVLSNEKTEDLVTAYAIHLTGQYSESVAAYLCSGIKRYLREYLAGATQFNFPQYRRNLFHQYLKQQDFDLNNLLVD